MADVANGMSLAGGSIYCTASGRVAGIAHEFQNCNQGVTAVLGIAWNPSLDQETTDARLKAQRWLKETGYSPSRFDVSDRLVVGVATAIVPCLHSDEHPADDLHETHYRISMPAAIDALVHDAVLGATCCEFCHNQRHIVIRRGWTQTPAGCEPGEQDRVVLLD